MWMAGGRGGAAEAGSTSASRWRGSTTVPSASAAALRDDAFQLAQIVWPEALL